MGIMNKQSMLRVLKILLPALFTLLVIFMLFSKLDIGESFLILSNSNPYWLSVAVVLSFVIMVVRAQRWRLILAHIGLIIGLRQSFEISMASLPFWIIAPATSGDLVKSVFLRRRLSISKTVGSVACENVFDLFSLLVLSLIGFIFFFDGILATIVIVMLVLVVAVLFLSLVRLNFLRKYSFAPQMRNFMQSMHVVMKRPSLFADVAGYTFLSWFLSMLQVYLLFKVLNLDIPFLLAMANIPLAILVGMIPIALGGVGTRDAAIILLFQDYASPEFLLGIGILFTVVRYLLLAGAGLFFLRRMKEYG